MVEDITIQPTENPNMRVYNTRYELSSSPEQGYRGASPELSEFGKLILAIDGVVSVTLGPYVLLVTKAPLFVWNEVEPKVVEILSELARSQRADVGLP
jgi:hypothetical protein